MSPTSAGVRRWAALSGPWPAVVLAMLILLPFVNKAFHLDDTVFLRDARQIRQSPLRPYSYDYNWYRSPQSRWVTSNTPPLNAYILSLLIIPFGENEIAIHLVYLAMAAASAFFMYRLAARWCRHPFLAVALTLASPAFLVSATGVMADIPLLLFWLMAVEWTLQAAQEPARAWRLWPAGAAVCAAALTKYFGLGLVLLLWTWWLVHVRRLTVHLIGLILPVVALLAWGWYSKIESGSFHPVSSAAYSSEFARDTVLQIANTVVFLGGAILWPILLIPLALKLPRRAALAAGLACVMMAILCLKKIPEPVRPIWSLMGCGGVLLLVVCALSVRRRPQGPADTLLGLWLIGTLIFVMLLNWTVAARVLLPAVFPAAVLLLRWVESLDSPGIWIEYVAVSFVLSVSITFLLALADREFAAAGRSFAQSTIRGIRQTGGRIFFAGHWGLQHYLEREGCEAFNYARQNVQHGDWIVLPLHNTNMRPIQLSMKRAGEFTFPNPYPFQLISAVAHAGFYSTLWGPVPFVLNQDGFVDKFYLFRVDLNK